MPRRVFYSFDYESDAWRASMIRNIGIIKSSQPASDNTWETMKRGGDSAIRRWIDEQLHGRSCTIVLIGSNTAHRRWVKYEIEESWERGKGLLGICIHKLLDQNQEEADPGPNPFDAILLPDGKPLSFRVHTYEPPGATSKEVYTHISKNLADWIEMAIAARKTANTR